MMIPKCHENIHKSKTNFFLKYIIWEIFSFVAMFSVDLELVYFKKRVLIKAITMYQEIKNCKICK